MVAKAGHVGVLQKDKDFVNNLVSVSSQKAVVEADGSLPHGDGDEGPMVFLEEGDSVNVGLFL